MQNPDTRGQNAECAGGRRESRELRRSQKADIRRQNAEVQAADEDKSTAKSQNHERMKAERGGPPAALHDIAGRRVLDLLPGANDVSRLSPGVYFVAASGERSAVGVRKVIVQR
jgi:hypothetical protein